MSIADPGRFTRCEWCGRQSGGALLCDVCERWEPWKLSTKQRKPYNIDHLVTKQKRVERRVREAK